MEAAEFAICAQVIATLVNQVYLALASLNAAKNLHESMLSALLRAPMSFFHSNPLGRILNRFSKDTSDVDKNVANYTSMAIRSKCSPDPCMTDFENMLGLAVQKIAESSL